MTSSESLTPSDWLERYCPRLDGQFIFLDPLSWQTFVLTEGAVTVLHEAAAAIEENRFEAFLADVEQAGGWPPGLEFLARGMTTLRHGSAYALTE